MKIYILSATLLVYLTVSAQSNTQQESASKPMNNPTQGYIIANNGEVITITDKATGKATQYPANDTLHYTMLRKIEAEREAARKQAPAAAPKRENVVR